MERIYELDFEVHADGSIDLEQDAGYGEEHRITLHPCHVRYLFEKAGHLLPPAPTNELAKRLARQLRDVHATLANEFGCSRGVDETITKLAAYIDALPESLANNPAPCDVPEAALSKSQNEQDDHTDFQLTKG